MPCKDCRAKCCAIYNVEIQEAEIQTLANHLSVTVEELKRTHLHTSPCNNSACKKTHYVINTKLIGREPYCTFLDEKTFLCGVYDVRPLVCSRFQCARFLENKARLAAV